MSKVTDKVLKMSNDAAAQRISEEQKKVEDRINTDLKVIKEILELVKDRLVYKEIKDKYSNRREYLVVTEDILLEDFSVEADNFSRGTTSIRHENSGYYGYPHIVIRVNGHLYHHAADLINKYKNQAETAMRNAEKELDYARERKEAIKNLEDLEPTIKQLMLNYNKYVKEK